MQLSANALTVLRKRYLRKKGSTYETPEELFSRVAKDVVTCEDLPKKKKEELVEAYTNMMANLEFLPNTPTLVNAGTGNGCAYAACYVLDVEDSLDHIFATNRKAALIQKAGGGVGMDWSSIRPRDAMIKSTGYKTRGVVQFIKIYADAMSVVDQGGIRPSANMGILSVHHPDIVEFINMKHSGAAQNMNISVAVTDEFMKAKDEGKKYNLYFPIYGNREKAGELDAKDIWDKIIAMAWRVGDPGIVWIDRVNRDNPTPSLGMIKSSNPCVIGDTLIAVADGRNAISIEQLAVEGKDVPVYSRNLKTGQVEIKWGRNPRLTGEKKEVWKITLDDDSTVIATPDHKFIRRNGEKMALKDLVAGDSLMPFYTGSSAHKYRSKYRYIHEGSSSIRKSSHGAGYHYPKNQYLMIYEFMTGDKINHKIDCVHHKDYNPANDGFNNLKKITIKEHKDLHDISGDKNPMHRVKDMGVYCEKRSELSIGLNNPSSRKHGAMPVDEWYEQIMFWAKTRLRAPGVKEVYHYCKKLGLPGPTKFRLRELGFPEGRGFRSALAECVGVPMFLGHHKGSKINHKVKSVNFYGYEDVYNITVDDNHNYNIITSGKDHKFIVSSGVCSANCGETFLYGDEACVLGSINLASVLKKKVDVDGVVTHEWNHEKIDKLVPLAVRFLDAIIDVSPQPLLEIKEAMIKTRKIGLGVMGFADAMIKMKIQYNSMQGIEQAEHIMGYINNRAIEASVELGKEKGVFPAWELDKVGTPRRNAIVTTIAPTGSISLIAGVSSGIEPVYAMAYTRIAFGDKKLSELHVDFEEEIRRRNINIPDLFDVVFNEHAGSVQKMNISDDMKRIFVTAHDIEPEWHVRMQAAFQKHTGNSISKTINMKKDSTIEDIDEAYRLSYKLGCKGVTIYRDGSKGSQILSSGVQSQPVGQNGGFGPRVRIEAPIGRTYEIPFGYGDALITVNEDDIGLCEVIIKAGRSGSPIAAEAEVIGRLVSLLMRCNVATKNITKQLRGISAGETAFYKGGRTISSLADAVCAAIENHIEYKLPKRQNAPTKNKYENTLTYKQNCPECGMPVAHLSKCIECQSCGWSKCK